MTTPPIRLAFGAALLRIFLGAALVKEIGLWRLINFWLGGKGTGYRLAVLVLHSPRMLFEAFAIAAMTCVVLDVLVTLVGRPLVARWYSPRLREDDMASPVAFRLASDERIRDEIPARMIHERRAAPGVLVRTDRRVYFAPHAWDVEPWSLEDRDLAAIVPTPSPSYFRKLIRGLPDRLVFRDRQGAEFAILVADPRSVLRWYRADVPDDDPAPLDAL